MKSLFGRPKGPFETPFTRLSQAGTAGDDTGQIKRIRGFENTGSLNPENTVARQIEVIEQSAERILGTLKQGRDRDSALADFDGITSEVKSHLELLQISTGGIDERIAELRKQISGK